MVIGIHFLAELTTNLLLKAETKTNNKITPPSSTAANKLLNNWEKQISQQQHPTTTTSEQHQPPPAPPPTAPHRTLITVPQKPPPSVTRVPAQRPNVFPDCSSSTPPPTPFCQALELLPPMMTSSRGCHAPRASIERANKTYPVSIKAGPCLSNFGRPKPA